MTIEPEILELIEEIRSDRFRGASELARLSISTLKMAAERNKSNNIDQIRQDQKAIAEYLMSSRPSMAPVFNVVHRLLKVVEAYRAKDAAAFKEFTVKMASEILTSSYESADKIAAFAAEICTIDDVIITHSYSSTVTTALKEIYKKRPKISAIITRSGVTRTGENMAQQVSSVGIPVTFIDDAGIGIFIGKAKKVFVGADRICNDSQVINGVGTYLLALAAKRHGVPFFVLCETLKFDPRLSGSEVYLEEKSPDEVVHPGVLPPQVRVKNPYFDLTPSDLVTGVISECGLMSPAEVVQFMHTLPG